jgi:hypothetical protein
VESGMWRVVKTNNLRRYTFDLQELVGNLEAHVNY